MLPPATMDTSPPDSLFPQPLIHGGQRQFNRNPDVVPDPAGAAPVPPRESVDGNDVRAAAGNAAGDGGDVVHGGHLDDDGLFIFGDLFDGVDQLAQVLNGVIS